MVERPNFIKKQVNNLVDGLIASRQSGEPIFGVPTVFASLIDTLAQKRETQRLASVEPSGGDKPTKYY